MWDFVICDKKRMKMSQSFIGHVMMFDSGNVTSRDVRKKSP